MTKNYFKYNLSKLKLEVTYFRLFDPVLRLTEIANVVNNKIMINGLHNGAEQKS